jgi:CYTH domain-containing protein
MPVENERKYVLDVNDIRAFNTDLSRAGQTGMLMIKQGYLRGDARIRSTFEWGKRESYTFTYKIAVRPNKLIEIETEISQDDFDDLWSIADRKIEKTRNIIPVGTLKWEVDYFYDPSGDMYLVMAEIELDQGYDEPSYVPPFITDHLLYRVTLTDNRFFNTALSDPQAVRETIDELKLLR